MKIAKNAAVNQISSQIKLEHVRGKVKSLDRHIYIIYLNMVESTKNWKDCARVEEVISLERIRNEKIQKRWSVFGYVFITSNDLKERKLLSSLFKKRSF